MRTTAIVKSIFVIIICAILLLPAIQCLFHLPEISNIWLSGKTEEVAKPKLSVKNWLNESFQKQTAAYFDFNAGYKPLLVRLSNEINYRLFDEAELPVIIGKRECLFHKNYIDAYIGKDIMAYEYLRNRSIGARHLQKLADGLGKKCLYIIAPGKASYESENIPDYYLKQKKPSNNYTLLKVAFNETQLEHLDLYDYFLNQKKTTKFPLFSQYGTHWSYYGAGVALDTIIRYLEKDSAYHFPKWTTDSIKLSQKPRGTDRDLLDLMNIISTPCSQQLAYPHFKSDSTIVVSPKILVVGDSYIWTLNQCGLMPALTGKNTEYWYYGNTVYDYNIKATGIEVKNLNLKTELNKFDIILFVFTETSQTYFDFDMAEKFSGSIENTKVN